MIGYVIGDSDMVTGFRLVGLEGVEVNSADEAKHALTKVLNRSDVAIIILSDAFSTDPAIREEVDSTRQERLTPMIVEVPASKGPANKTSLSESISKVLGIKI